MRRGKKWSEEELEYLEDKWGAVSIKGIAKKLNRSVNAVKLKAQRMGLGDARSHFDGITVSQLSLVLNTHYGILKNWIKLYDFPARKKVFAAENKVLVVTYQDFWKWAKENRHMLDFSRFERLSLGPEPKWVEEKRKADQIKKLHVPKPHNTPWSKDDDEKLKWMLNQFKYTYPEIAEELKRSQAAVKRRILDLGLKQRPIRLPNHIKYSPEEERLLIDLLGKGYCFEEIADRLNRSALGVRGKAERLGYKFKNGVPYLEKEIG
ncbi:hypothetical protein QNH23_06405 [Siminovitchia fortis]|uniref:Myb-like domain-containing protein n=1 Tax=Siminovitchia fortis TaxID=254758 RepID=A0A443IM51_9BACI|nr:hypothetical protein [Siminovitchia fortis]RWR06735.1 hypothetical protein D4N35_013805 [Siminovitchia fortis]WHY83003.1 hypothetical protein QNH23_06405 [Siminovitchia fortis]